MRLIVLDGNKRSKIDELSGVGGISFFHLVSQYFCKLQERMLGRFLDISKLYVVTQKRVEDNEKNTHAYEPTPIYSSSVKSLFNTYGKEMLEATYAIVDGDIFPCVSALPSVEKVALLAPVFFCDRKMRRILAVIKGRDLYDIACSKSILTVDSLYSAIKNENQKMTVLFVDGEFFRLRDGNDIKRAINLLLKDGNLCVCTEKRSGVYCTGNMPTGDYILLPPVYIGKGVQIESGAIIGPNSVLGDYSLVSEFAQVKNSYIGRGVYISKNCSVNGAIIGDEVSVRKDSVVCDGSVLGAGTLVGEGAVIERNSFLKRNSSIDNDYDYFTAREGGIQSSLLVDGDNPTPSDSARLGAMLAHYANGTDIAVFDDGDARSVSLKNAFMSGASYCGASVYDCGKCIYRQSVSSTEFIGEAFVVFISARRSHSFSFFNTHREEFSRRDICEMCNVYDEFLPLGESTTAKNGKFWHEMYLNKLQDLLSVECDFSFSAECAEPLAKKEIDIINRFGNNGGGRFKIHFTVNNDGDRVFAHIDDKEFSHEKLLSVCVLDSLKHGESVDLPWNAPVYLSEISGEITRNSRVKSSKCCSDFKSPDAFFLIANILKILSKTGLTLGQLCSEIPDYYVAERIVEADAQPCSLRDKTDVDLIYSNGVATIKTDNGNAKIKRGMYRNRLHIITEALNADFSEELMAEISQILVDNNSHI